MAQSSGIDETQDTPGPVASISVSAIENGSTAEPRPASLCLDFDVDGYDAPRIAPNFSLRYKTTHKGEARCAAFSADGKYAVYERTIIWLI
jgi:hypothetical protein